MSTPPPLARRILAVEDNPANLELMAYLLRSRGHVVVEARNADEARAAITDQQLDLLVLDIRLPDANGLELLGELRRAAPRADVAALAVTAYAMADDRDDAIAAGFDGYVVKPIDPRTFGDTVDALLGGCAPSGTDPSDAAPPATAPPATAAATSDQPSEGQ
jgi:two-component system cell cycle response regulator